MFKYRWGIYKEGKVSHAIKEGYEGKYLACNAQYFQCGIRFTNYIDPSFITYCKEIKCKKCLKITGEK